MGLVGGDHERRAAEGEALEAVQHADDARGAELRLEQLRRQVVVVEDHLAPEQAGEEADAEEGVGRVVEVDHGGPRSSSSALREVEAGVGDRVLEHEAEGLAGVPGRRKRRTPTPPIRSRRGCPGARGAHTVTEWPARARLSASLRTRTSCG